MKSSTWILAVAVASSVAFTAVPARSEDKEHAVQAPPVAVGANVGDQIECVMDGMKMVLTPDTPSIQYKGNVYYFCSADEIATFLADPEKYTKKPGEHADAPEKHGEDAEKHGEH